MGSVVVSVRVPRKLKEEAESLGIDIRRVVEEALRHAVKEERKKRIAEALKEIAEAGSLLSEEEWVKAVRDSRRRRIVDNT